MNRNMPSLTLRSLSIGSIILGLAGGLFYWWVPFGMVLSIAGLVYAFIDWVSARRRSVDFRLAIAGLVISAATLIFDIIIAGLGLQLLTFGGQP
jgi:hypothetical protein